MKNKPIIILINGISEAGKDSFCDFCGCYCSKLTTSTVDRVKEIAKDIFGWDGVKDEKGRKLLASVRQAWGDYNDGPLMHVVKIVEENLDKNIIFVMIREHNEIIKAKELFISKGFYCRTLWVERFGNIPGPTEQKFIESIPKDYTYDYTVHNDSDLNFLKKTAKDFVNVL